MEINKNILILCFFVCVSAFGQKDYPTVLIAKDTSEYKKERTYFIQEMDSTNNYYILKTTTIRDTAVLIIKKSSNQLIEDIKTNQSFTFSTYRYGNFINPKHELCHYVEEKLVWCAKDYYEKNLELYFTDDMGNVTYEEASYELDENLEIDSHKKERKYIIKSINTTERYYILETLFEQSATVLIVAKQSKQLKNSSLQKGETINFYTYTIDDVYKFYTDLCHVVDLKIVWCNSDSTIHFTDGMGNGLYENEEGW